MLLLLLLVCLQGIENYSAIFECAAALRGLNPNGGLILERPEIDSHDVALWPLADITTVLIHVRFRGNSGHRANLRECPLLTQSGHWQFGAKRSAFSARIVLASFLGVRTRRMR